MASRCTGALESRGTYAAPVRSVAYTAAIVSTRFGR